MGAEKREATVNFMKKLYDEIPKEELQVTLATLMKMDQNIGIIDI